MQGGYCVLHSWFQPAQSISERYKGSVRRREGAAVDKVVDVLCQSACQQKVVFIWSKTVLECGSKQSLDSLNSKKAN